MNNTHKIFVSIIVMLIVVGCSTKKDAFLNRNFHAVNTKYNILFNGHEALRIGLEQLNGLRNQLNLMRIMSYMEKLIGLMIDVQ